MKEGRGREEGGRGGEGEGERKEGRLVKKRYKTISIKQHKKQDRTWYKLYLVHGLT